MFQDFRVVSLVYLGCLLSGLELGILVKRGKRLLSDG